MGDGGGLTKRTEDPAAAAAENARSRSRSESATLAVAVMAAVALGVGLGMWVTSRLPPPPSAGAATAARLLPDAPVASAPAERPSPCEGCETPPADVTSERVPIGRMEEARPTTEPGAREATPDADAKPARADEVAAVDAEPKGVTNSETVARASPDPPRPVAWQVGPLPKAGARAVAQGNVGQGAAQGRGRASGGGAQAQSGPCALYASASALNLRMGGAAPLVLGGPGQGVRINVNTPDWSQIAVIYEGPAAGHNGWLRYSVRSVGRRPGLYTVRFSTPCGSQTIPVTVK